jgi:hypothetical protein
MFTRICVRGKDGEILQINLPGELDISITSSGGDLRVSCNDAGGVSVVNENDAANTIQKAFRRRRAMMLAREQMDEMRMRAWEEASRIASEEEDARNRGHRRNISELTRMAAMEPIHGLARGSANGNDRGSFWISGSTGKVLSYGKAFGKDGDQRWAVGMKGEDYCHSMRIVGTGKNKTRHCICNCWDH